MAVATMGHEMTVDDGTVTSAIDYEGRVSREEGLAELRERDAPLPSA